MATVAIHGRRDALVARTTTNRALLRAFLERDRLFAAYAICDLDAREFSRTRWGAAFDGDGVGASMARGAEGTAERTGTAATRWPKAGATARSAARAFPSIAAS